MKSSTQYKSRQTSIRNQEVVFCGLIAFSILCFAFRAWHLNRYTWRSLELPLHMETGQQEAGHFVAEVDTTYELEVAFDFESLGKNTGKFVTRMDKPSPLELNWSVWSDQKQIAMGNCRDYAYFVIRKGKLGSRVNTFLMNYPYYPISRNGMAARGVGSFTARAGQTYEIHTHVGMTWRELMTSGPRLVVRPNRLFWLRHSRQSLYLVYMGCAGLALGCMLFASLLFSTIRNRSRTQT